ncbi:MAG: MFS transporter [Syntrophomonadaceae bacterium]|nr:MFS transporter [Syntrophomonadaceae bacterium]
MANKNLSQERVTLLVVTGTAFLVPFIGSAINLALPLLGEEYDSSALLLGWVVTAYLLAAAALLLPFGRLADIIGRRKVFLSGLGFFTLVSFLCSQATSVEMLVALRLLQGVAAAMIFSTSIAILTSVYPPTRLGKALGVTVASTYTGLSVGPVLGGWMNHVFGWRSIFYFIVVISLLATMFTAFWLKGEWRGAQGERYDLAGALLYVVGLTAFLYGVSSLSTSTWAWYAAGLGVVCLGLFVWFELGQEHPLIRMKLFVENITFAFSNLAAMINYSATFGLGFLLSIYLQVIMGYNSQTAGLILLSQPLMMALFSPLAGSLSDRIEPRKVATTGMLLSTIGIFVFVFLSQQTSIYLLISNLALIGLGFALFSSPNTNAVMSSVPPRLYGIASSTLGTMRNVGQAVSMAIVTLIMAAYLGQAQLSQVAPEVLMSTIHIAFMIFFVLCCLGVAASWARGGKSEAGPQSSAA